MPASAPADTDIEVFRRQVDRWRKMDPAERANLANQLSIDVVSMASAGIRHRWPEISDRDLTLELLRRRHGRVLADAAWSHHDPA